MPLNAAPTPPSACRDLAHLRAPGGGLYASMGEMFRDAFFGRDSLEAAEDLIDSEPGLAHDVILALAALQGVRDVPGGARSTEEERGRIHHEARSRVIGGRIIDAESQALLAELAAKWGGDANSMTYYGTIDATALFVRIVERYCTRVGSTAILDERYIDRSGVTRTIREATLEGAEWLARTIEESQRTSGWGLVERRRRNPRGLEYQGWRDGRMSHIHPARVRSTRRTVMPQPRAFEECGEMVDPDQSHAFIETQGVAYDALMAASRIATGAAAERYARLAITLRDNVIRHFWMPGENYFAAAVDCDEMGRPRQVRTIGAAPAELLDTGIFDGLPEADRVRYVGALVRRIAAPDMLTAAGIRTTSLRHRDQLDHVAYQGVFTVWHKQTWDIAKGLRRHGFARFATQLENRILNTCNASGTHAEYVYVDGAGHVCLDPSNRRGRAHPTMIPATNIPDKGQTWTVTAALAIKRLRGRLASQPASATSLAVWAPCLDEVALITRIPSVRLAKRRAELSVLWNASHGFVVDRELGGRLQDAFTARAEEAWRRGPQAPGQALGA